MPTNTYNFTGGWQTFTVPAGVKSITVRTDGAGSGTRRGGRVSGRLTVTPGRKLLLLVGEAGNGNSGATGGKSALGGGGRGGNGYRTSGGNSGGGWSGIRVSSTAGKILCIAGGAGGDSGDGGAGGDGGTTTGESGSRGNAGNGATGAATGGTQTQGGSGGTSSSGRDFFGGDPGNGVLDGGGAGGDTGRLDGPGGGGGGGGFHPGGGGQGGSAGYAPGGGGGGGSNFIGELVGAQSLRGANSGNGQIVISWTTPPPAIRPPNTPSTPNPAKGTRTRSTGKLPLGVRLSDPAKRKVRALWLLSPDGKFSSSNTKRVYSSYVQQDANDGYRSSRVDVSSLAQNTHYRARIYAQNDKGKQSTGYTTTDFYTNYDPLEPTLLTPRNGVQNDGLNAIVFTWRHRDSDGGSQANAQLQVVNSSTDTLVATYVIHGSSATFTIDGAALKSNNFYTWRVRTQDAQGRYGPWSSSFRFYVAGVSVAPRLHSPKDDEAVDVGSSTTFVWKFFDPNPSEVQVKADLRYRVIGTDDWITKYGSENTPGASASWTFGARLFQTGLRYEWQVRTYDSGSGGVVPSNWSTSQTFVTIPTPGYLANRDPVVSPAYDGQLGHGHNRVALVTKGGHNYLGEFKDCTLVRWNRVRDDISKATVIIPLENNSDNAVLGAVARTWQHELKIHRSKDEGGEGSFVWEGPITNIRIEAKQVTIEAQDVMVWPYRRALRQGFSDAGAGRSVVERAGRILINALAIDDPNVLPWLTMIQFSDDTKQSRVRPDFCSTAWQEVDDMAAKAGLDYTVVGRRIILNDTHRPIGKLPTMTDADFDSPLIVTEYGMTGATRYWVTNGNGVFGGASRSTDEYGYIEMVVSAYGEAEAAADETLTTTARAKLKATFEQQADRGIGNRYPMPVQVRVPDGTGINPDCPITIDALVPGVWVPLKATQTIRAVSQWQKLDRVEVEETPEGGETVKVTMLSAPNQGEDPDAAEDPDSSGDDDG